MTLVVDVSNESVRSPLGRESIAHVARRTLRAERVRDAFVSITVVDRRAIVRLNTQHLGHRGATDVISFGFTRSTRADPILGDVYICADVARVNAKERRVGVREEIARLVVHGVLHILGYDHPDGDRRERSGMWKRQERLLQRFGGAVRR